MKKDSKTPWMDKALAPRDRDGFIQPMIWPGGTDQTGKPLYFPVLPTSKGPMIFEEDFQPGGQYYGQVDYQPGLYAAPLGITANGLQSNSLCAPGLQSPVYGRCYPPGGHP